MIELNNKYKLKIRDIDTLKAFVKMCEKWEYDIDCKRGRIVCDGRSLLGLIALDTTQEFTVEIHCNDCDDLLEFYEDMKLFGGELIG